MDAYLVQRQATPTSENGGQPTRTPDGFVVENGRIVPYWYTRVCEPSSHSTLEDQHREANRPQQEGLIVKWSVFLGLMVLITLYITIGYIHAKKRIRKGLVPLAYHRVSCLNPMYPLAISLPSPTSKGHVSISY